MKNFKEIDRIYFNIENLTDDFQDLPEARAAYREAMNFLIAHKMPEKITLEVDNLLGEIAFQSERQGFIHGFSYAIRLLMGE